MMAKTNEAIMTEYLVKYSAMMMNATEHGASSVARSRPTELLEALYMSERYSAGDDLHDARRLYDVGIWSGVQVREIKARLAAMDAFMRDFAKGRLAAWSEIN